MSYRRHFGHKSAIALGLLMLAGLLNGILGMEGRGPSQELIHQAGLLGAVREDAVEVALALRAPASRYGRHGDKLLYSERSPKGVSPGRRNAPAHVQSRRGLFVDLTSLSQLGQAVGGFFVVLSLIYLARQVRQNSKLLITENYGRVLDRMSAVQSRLSVDPGLHHIVVVGAQSPGALTSSERVRFTWAMFELFGAGEFMYHQAQADALPSDVWERWEATIAWWISHPGMQAWWEAKPTPFTSDYEAFVDRKIRADAVDPARIDRWEGFVAGEGLPGADAAQLADEREAGEARDRPNAG